MTPKYLQDEIDYLKALRAGITANPDQWVNLANVVTQTDEAIQILENGATQMDNAEIALKKLKATIHILADEQGKIGDQVENLARGLHAAEPEKLLDYDITAKRKDAVALPVPEKASIAGIADDIQNEGFVLNIQSLVNATDFEIWRGVSTSPDTLSLEPDQFAYLSTTKRLSFTDDAIVKGKRYFYRVRGFNRNGKGEWSAIVSRVQ